MSIDIIQEVTYFDEVGRDGQLGFYVKVTNDLWPPQIFGPFSSAKAAKDFYEYTPQTYTN